MTIADTFTVSALEYIFEGYLLHYGEQPPARSRMTANFDLLAGDYMYARGLERIAELDDLDCIKALADLVQALFVRALREAAIRRWRSTPGR